LTVLLTAAFAGAATAQPQKIPSRMDLRTNADGSVDIYTGPKAPKVFEKNRIPTVPGRNWFAYFRFYNPTEAYFDRSWPLPSAACGRKSWTGYGRSKQAEANGPK
jgi:hypothetical protein